MKAVEYELLSKCGSPDLPKGSESRVGSELGVLNDRKSSMTDLMWSFNCKNSLIFFPNK